MNSKRKGFVTRVEVGPLNMFLKFSRVGDRNLKKGDFWSNLIHFNCYFTMAADKDINSRLSNRLYSNSVTN